MSVPKIGSVADLKKGLSELTQIKEDMVREGRREGGKEGRREGGREGGKEGGREGGKEGKWGKGGREGEREGGGGGMTLDFADGDSGCIQQSVPPYL